MKEDIHKIIFPIDSSKPFEGDFHNEIKDQNVIRGYSQIQRDSDIDYEIKSQLENVLYSTIV